MLADVGHRLGVVDADRRARLEQRVDQHQGRGLADVVGPGLEGQAPDGDRLARELAAEVVLDLVEAARASGASLTASTASIIRAGRPWSAAMCIQRADVLGEAAAAVADAGEQEVEADRLSWPMPRRTSLMSAPIRSQRLAISLMKLILVASRQLATYLVISALSGDITRNGRSVRRNGAYSSCSTSRDFGPADADDHAVGLDEVVDRRPFLEELGVAGDVERGR